MRLRLLPAPRGFFHLHRHSGVITHQHASLMIKAGGKMMYVDPAQGKLRRLPQADYILITDIHGDHMAPPVVAKLKKARP